MLLERKALLLDLTTLQLHGPSGCIDVTDAECKLLRAFANSAGLRMELASLLLQCALSVDRAGKRALGVRIVRLRKKLLATGAGEPTVKSIRGNGYQLCVPLAVHSGGAVSFASPARKASHV